MMIKLYSCFLVMLFLISCQNSNNSNSAVQTKSVEAKPIQQGNADKLSSVIADASMEAMGGYAKWDSLHYISWTFFGSRKLVWDKWGGRVRIESPRDTSIYLVNLYTLQGRYIKNGIEEKDPDILSEKMKRAEGIWINDSYWLVMPFKLRDEGVNLKYLREDTLQGGVRATVLEMTFDNVGNTPDNKYEVYVSTEDNLIKKWSFFKTSDQIDPPRSWPWDNYQDFNGLLISSDRSDKSGPSEVKVYDVLDDSVFNDF